MIIARRAPSLVSTLLAAAALGEGLPFVERQMFGRTLAPTAALPPVDEEKRAIRRLMRKDRKNPAHKANRKRRGF